MKIDYICFTVPDKFHTDFEVSSLDSDNVKEFKRRDALLFKDASAKKMAIVYDRSMHRFTKGNCPVNLRGKTVLYRGNVYFQGEITKMLEREGANSLQKARDSYIIRDWPMYVQPMHRTVYRTTYAGFIENYDKYKDLIETLHIKSVEGHRTNKVLTDYGFKKKGGETVFFTRPKLDTPLDEEVYIEEAFSKVPDPENDEDGREYRALVINGELINVSRSFVKEKVDVPGDVLDEVRRVVYKNNINYQFPKTYAVDIAEMFIDEKRVIDVVSYKNPCATELSLHFDLIKAIEEYNEQNSQEEKE